MLQHGPSWCGFSCKICCWAAAALKATSCLLPCLAQGLWTNQVNLNAGLIFEDLGDFQRGHLCLHTDEPSCALGCIEPEVRCQDKGGQSGASVWCLGQGSGAAQSSELAATGCPQPGRPQHWCSRCDRAAVGTGCLFLPQDRSSRELTALCRCQEWAQTSPGALGYMSLVPLL